MKLITFLLVTITIMAAFAACKPSYKATDRTKSTTATSTTDNTVSATDPARLPSATDSTKMPTAPDSTNMPARPDSTKMPVAPEPAKMPAAPDSTTMPAAPDSTKMPVAPDPAKIPAAPDSTKMPAATDPVKLPAAPDSTRTPSATDAAKVPAAADSTNFTLANKAPATTITVPEGTETAFKTQYPAATDVVWTSYDSLEAVPTDWKMTGWTTPDAKDQVVRFDLKNENYYAWYDSDGKWIGSSYKMKDPTKIPATLRTTVKTKYPGYSITSVNRKLQKDRKGYEVELEKDDENKLKLLVNAEGKIIKVIKYVNEKTK